ncbi:MAG: glycerate kinase [Acidobacteriota bacterium]|nr:glycerate kinase [Acidobacteriota bacterium]
MRRHFLIPSGDFDRTLLIAVGKAACPMAEAVQEMLGNRLHAALVITKQGHLTSTLKNVQAIEAGHPIPDDESVRASRAVTERVRGLNARDLLIVAVSGGASALLSAPAPPITLADKQLTTDLLLRAGANIHELNAVRKHLSTLKGGHLAGLAYPATVVALLLSDVVRDQLDVIGSGLTAPDPTTAADAVAVLSKFGLLDRVPPSVRERLQSGAETPKPGDRIFEKVQNIVVGSNRLALEAAAERAAALGLRTSILPNPVEGEARIAAREHAGLLKQTDPPACILSGGETIVTVTGSGKGGRNQEFALAAALQISGEEGLSVLSAGTDGTDGPTDAAGAFVDGSTVTRAASLGLDAREYLANHDSYHFFEAIGDLVKTGPTGTNVMDINIMLARKS